MTVTHEPWLVALSLVMAFQGSFVGLSLAVQVRNAADPRRRLLLVGAALTLALAIWSMHFVGMLAVKFPLGVDFLVLPTLLSFLVCVLVVGVAVFTASNRRLTSVRLGLAAFVMGAGICTMHYLGMYSLHKSLQMVHNPTYVLASFLIAFNAAGLALWLLFGLGKRPPIVISAAVMALAISAMHYTAMSGMTYELTQTAGGLSAPSLGPGTLAIFVSCVAFLVSGLFLLALVPAENASTAEANGGDAEVDLEFETVPNTHQPNHKPTEEAIKRAATGLQAAASSPRKPSTASKRTLPIERDGQKTQIGISDVAAIHADAHYTKLYDGQREYFCPLSISEAEQLLDSKIFKRVHRSHIVNLSRVTSFKRSGDGGVLILEGTEAQSVPVSRSRWGRIRNRLTALADKPEQQGQPAAAQ
ncbi:MHYT domain-containing protein [Roseibium album]|uniref:CO-responsive transcriptional regulator RcoM n=1 Tax=Roseibium album TaxID=311410 RepID=A0A0M6ZMJ8_9HYPH|nr:MHYT domain-containing protein [Roseibium album]MBG6147234.1 NO-binding membrane sensor protein with MHYT domain [Labrenzia sp. EL_142]MBG6204826.1 NO-binding membrane sensor protein with MHYT domain [Labrenzia sp. EL_13]CTQ62653.1 CO-responsive transcriptional regulator RcoM [Roseibium album]CTQ78979.1 CO-responsive transcriptional regulator RcoM [Roseibium album]CTQ80366.1 CO-responsive transcriptional regulator RcoM [Roseibium album]